MTLEPKMSSNAAIHPKPPPTLRKETVGVWHGWCSIGDKEVIREAATKGTHVDLAITFLSYRKQINQQNAEVLFKSEVVKWILELLDKKQIFKASHVLSNIKVDPSIEFSNIFYMTHNNELREYIGNHLIKSEKMPENCLKLWRFFNLILEHVKFISAHFSIAESIACLEDLDKQSAEWKSQVSTFLLLYTDNSVLSPFLTGETLWKHLLAKNDVTAIHLWINLRYNSELDESFNSGAVVEQFKRFPITSEMLELEIPLEIEDSILNEFSKFGIFRDNEKNNFIVILKRLKNTYSIQNLYKIFTQTSSLVSVDHFIKLLIDFCLEKNLLIVLSVCVQNLRVIPKSSKYLTLMCNYRSLVQNFNENTFRDNIFNTAIVLESDTTNYFNDNPLVLLALILFTKDINILDIMTHKSTFIVNELDFIPCLRKFIKYFPNLTIVCANKSEIGFKCNLTYYDLLDKHLEVDSRQLFEFRFDQGGQTLPHFNYSELVQTYGYSKKINYKFYLNQSRPSTAAQIFTVSQLVLHDCIQEDELKSVEQKVFKIAISNFSSDEITSGCVAFLEMLGRDSSTIRVMIRAAKILLEAYFNRDSVLDMLTGSEDEPYNLQSHLETILFLQLKDYLFVTGSELIDTLKTYEILIQYSKINNLKLPENILKYFASNNLWLPFLIFTHVYQYPLDQVKLMIQFFKTPNMLEHLAHGIVNDIQVREKSALMRDRDSRNYLLSKLGVRKNADISDQNMSRSIKSQSSLGSEDSSSSSEIFEIDIHNFKATLLQTLIRCHNSTDPPKALLQACQLYRSPLLAIFATSYEPDSIINNWLTWLAVSCELCRAFTNYESVAINSTAVAKLLEDCMKSQNPRTLLESFEIFVPESPLKVFIELLNHCLTFNLAEENLVSKLETFQSSMKNCRRNSVFNKTDHEMTYLNNRLWIEETALALVAFALDYNCSSLYEQILIVDALCKVKIWNYFTIEFPNFLNLLDVLKVLFEEKTDVNIDIVVMLNHKNRRLAIVSCINKLLDKHHYEAAMKISQIENLPPDLILVREWQYKMENTRGNSYLWKDCDETFAKRNVTADCVIDFYIDCAEKLGDLTEKFTVLKLACDWASRYEMSNRYDLEQKMWIAYLYLDEKHKDLNKFSIKPSFHLYENLTESLKNVSVYDGGELSKECLKQLEKILVYSLNKGDFWQALKLQKMFSCGNSDLETLKLCFSLAEGILMPYQLNAQQRLLLSRANCTRGYSHRRTLLSTRVSGISSSSHSPLNSSIAAATETTGDSPTNDTLAILKVMSEYLRNGIEIGQNIFMGYRLSANVEMPYKVVVTTDDSMKLLKVALEEDCLNKLDVIHDFISVHKLSKNEVADFVCEELVNATAHHIQSKSDHVVMWDLDIDKNFQLMLQLLLQDNCSILGNKIFAYSSALQRTYMETGTFFTDLILVIELLIRAHDCFTTDCNMEGISMILKKSKEVISNLLALKEWQLMVRLLTGVARYTEMNYVFQILMENEQFEYLLRKNVGKKDNFLKLALLEFLKRFCPENKDLFKLVALHFTLFSEVAMLWEAEAQSVIKNLISISKLEMQNNNMNPDEEPFILFQNNEGTKICLNKAMENYKHATDFLLQGDKLSKAVHSAQQAELIALQVGLLSKLPSKGTVECLLNLTSKQIVSLISAKLTFSQAYILVEAYHFQVNWASVLYAQYVKKNDASFFLGYLQNYPLTDSLVHDISRKFANSNVNSINEIKCMKNILNHLQSIHAKYRIASELGFADLVEDLIAGGQLVYLKDTVWKKGYRN